MPPYTWGHVWFQFGPSCQPHPYVGVLAPMTNVINAREAGSEASAKSVGIHADLVPSFWYPEVALIGADDPSASTLNIHMMVEFSSFPFFHYQILDCGSCWECVLGWGEKGAPD